MTSFVSDFRNFMSGFATTIANTVDQFAQPHVDTVVKLSEELVLGHCEEFVRYCYETLLENLTAAVAFQQSKGLLLENSRIALISEDEKVQAQLSIIKSGSLKLLSEIKSDSKSVIYPLEYRAGFRVRGNKRIYQVIKMNCQLSAKSAGGAVEVIYESDCFVTLEEPPSQKRVLIQLPAHQRTLEWQEE